MNTKRTHTCGELNRKNENQEVVLNGWVDSVRSYGSLMFVDLRDRYGITQVVFDDSQDADLLNRAKGLHLEYCIAVIGNVRMRMAGQENKDRASGEIEVLGTNFHVFSKTRPHPFVVGDDEAPGEDVRMKYRFIDLRRASMQEALGFRSKVTHAVRSFLSEEGFWDIETPILAKSTPEGARDYLVPSRVNQGTFFALPQSPQQFKQLLMVGGCDKYYQIAKCFRDEDLRADRQPEFTQIDMEMSFADREDVFSVTERMVKYVFSKTLGIELEIPFPRMTYADAVENYASDKPDMRFSLSVATLNDLVKDSDFKVFSSVVETGGVVRGLAAPGIASWSRKMIKSLETVCTSSGAMGMAWLKYIADDQFEGPIAKFFPSEKALELAKRMKANQGDLMCFIADTKQTANASLHNLRNHLGKELNLYDPDEHNFIWVVDFPLFTWDQDDQRYSSEHHPFTAPIPQSVGAFEGDLGNIPSASYDLVYNGSEVASGSQRIHDPQVQKKVFEVLKMSEEVIKERFGFFIDALDYGTPPHAGIALGLDRILTLMLHRESIRDVIAFPKNAQATDLMTEAPSEVDPLQLEELGISFEKSEK